MSDSSNRGGSNKKVLPLGAALAGLLYVAGVGAESGVTREEVALRAAPYRDAKTLRTLAEDTRVEISDRRGAWLQVKAGEAAGWLGLHQVRLTEQAADSGFSFRGFFMLWRAGETGRSGADGLVATTGIRGLNPEELKGAKPDPAAVERLNGYRSKAAAAERYATEGGLKRSEVSWLKSAEGEDE